MKIHTYVYQKNCILIYITIHSTNLVCSIFKFYISRLTILNLYRLNNFLHLAPESYILIEYREGILFQCFFAKICEKTFFKNCCIHIWLTLYILMNINLLYRIYSYFNFVGSSMGLIFSFHSTIFLYCTTLSVVVIISSHKSAF